MFPYDGIMGISVDDTQIVLRQSIEIVNLTLFDYANWFSKLCPSKVSPIIG